MKRTYFDRYSDFKCIADKCPATCCSGWLIEIDEESLDMYQNLTGENGDFVREKIDFSDHSFKQQSNGDCAFLLSDGFCWMQRNMGEECLCTTCDMYPRHIEEFPGVREYSLSVSCPAVAEDFLKSQGKLEFYSTKDSAEDTPYEDFNEELYEILLACREVVLDILRDRTVCFDKRKNYMLSFMDQIQTLLDLGDVKSVKKLIKTVSKDIKHGLDRLKVKSVLYEMCRDYRDVFLSDSKEMINTFLELEPLNESFVEWLKTVAEADQDKLDSIDKIRISDFEEFDEEIMLERISVYFIFTYLCGAAYDDYVFALAREAVYNSYMIFILLKAEIMMTGSLSLKRASEILFRYSRELENSNENLIKLEQLLDV